MTLEFGRNQEIEALRNTLWTLGVPVETWGMGRANSFEDLVREIKDGESKLVIEYGEVIRLLDMLDLDVFYKDQDGNTFKLKEDRQEYIDGSGREPRRRNLSVSLMEKMKPGEKPEDAIKRALVEELQVEGEVDLRELTDKDVFDPSISYPGTYVRSKIYKGTVFLTPEQFNPDGYIEVQPGRKTTYFVWERV